MSHRIVAQTGWTALQPSLAGASRTKEPAKFAAMLAEGVPARTHDRVTSQLLKLRSTTTVVNDSATKGAEEVDGALSAGGTVKTGFVAGQEEAPVEQMPLPNVSAPPVEVGGGRSVVRQAPQKTVVGALEVDHPSTPGSVQTVKDKVSVTSAGAASTQVEPTTALRLPQEPAATLSEATLSEAPVRQQIPSLPSPVGPDAGENAPQDAPVSILSTGGRRLPVQGAPVSAAPVETSPLPGGGEVPIRIRTPSLPPSTGPVTEESGRRSAPPSSVLSRGGESVRRHSDLRSYSDTGLASASETVVGSGVASPSPVLKVAASAGPQVTAGNVDQKQGPPVLVSEVKPQPAVAPLPGATPQGAALMENAPDLSSPTSAVERSGPVAQPAVAENSASASGLISQRSTGEGSAVQVPRSAREKSTVKVSGVTAATHPAAAHTVGPHPAGALAGSALAGAHKMDAQPATAESSARPSGAGVQSADAPNVASSKVVPAHLLSPETLVQPAHVPVPGGAPESAKTNLPTGASTMPETVSTTSAQTNYASEPRTLVASAQALEVGVASGTHGWLRVRAELGHAGEVTASVIASSSRAAESLHRELPGLGEYLAREQVGISAVAVATAGFTPSATAGSNAAAAGAAGEQARQQAGSNGDFTGQNGSARTGDRQGATGSSASVDLSSSVAEMASLPGGTRGSGGWVNVRV